MFSYQIVHRTANNLKERKKANELERMREKRAREKPITEELTENLHAAYTTTRNTAGKALRTSGSLTLFLLLALITQIRSIPGCTTRDLKSPKTLFNQKDHADLETRVKGLAVEVKKLEELTRLEAEKTEEEHAKLEAERQAKKAAKTAAKAERKALAQQAKRTTPTTEISTASPALTALSSPTSTITHTSQNPGRISDATSDISVVADAAIAIPTSPESTIETSIRTPSPTTLTTPASITAEASKPTSAPREFINALIATLDQIIGEHTEKTDALEYYQRHAQKLKEKLLAILSTGKSLTTEELKLLQDEFEAQINAQKSKTTSDIEEIATKRIQAQNAYNDNPFQRTVYAAIFLPSELEKLNNEEKEARNSDIEARIKIISTLYNKLCIKIHKDDYQEHLFAMLPYPIGKTNISGQAIETFMQMHGTNIRKIFAKYGIDEIRFFVAGSGVFAPEVAHDMDIVIHPSKAHTNKEDNEKFQNACSEVFKYLEKRHLCGDDLLTSKGAARTRIMSMKIPAIGLVDLNLCNTTAAEALPERITNFTALLAEINETDMLTGQVIATPSIAKLIEEREITFCAPPPDNLEKIKLLLYKIFNKSKTQLYRIAPEIMEYLKGKGYSPEKIYEEVEKEATVRMPRTSKVLPSPTTFAAIATPPAGAGATPTASAFHPFS